MRSFFVALFIAVIFFASNASAQPQQGETQEACMARYKNMAADMRNSLVAMSTEEKGVADCLESKPLVTTAPMSPSIPRESTAVPDWFMVIAGVGILSLFLFFTRSKREFQKEQVEILARVKRVERKETVIVNKKTVIVNKKPSGRVFPRRVNYSRA